MSCVIVTGASRGFGAGIAEAFAADGRPVVMAARGEDDLRRAAAKLEADGARVLAVPADVSREEDVEHLVAQAVERFGRIDVLVNNAGAAPVLEELDRLSWDRWRRHIGVDVRGVFNTGRLVGPMMRLQGSGTIVNVASGAATNASALHVSYAPAQAALLVLSRCMSGWLAEAGVAVHCLCPTLTPAGGVGRAAVAIFARENGVEPEEWLDRRFGGDRLAASEVGAAVVELADEPSGAVWWIGPAGLERWEGVLSPPVRI
jgi:NAD(P)-dependent dehydrogenase (short-subunit alcohol dehydrogenase family)